MEHINSSSTCLNAPIDAYFKSVSSPNFISGPFFHLLVPNNNSSDAMNTNTAIIQAALDVGGNVTLPSGLYYINASLLIHLSNTQLTGQGVENTIIKWGTNATNDVILMNSSGVPVDNCSISNLTIDGSANAIRNTGNSITVTYAINCNFRNLLLYNSGGSALVIDGVPSKLSFNCYVENVITEFSYSYGIRLTQYTNFITVQNCTFQFTGDDAIRCAGTKSRVSGNVVYRSNISGIHLTSTCSRCQICDNIIFRVQTHSINLTGVNMCLISGNTCIYANNANTSQSMVSLASTSITSSLLSNLLFEDSSTTSDSGTSPNTVTVYPALAFHATTAFQMPTNSTSNLFNNNVIKGIATRFSATTGTLNNGCVIDTDIDNSLVNIYGGVRFNNTVANYSPTTLNYYEELTLNNVLVFGYVASSPIQLRLVRVGKTVTLNIPAVSGTADGLAPSVGITAEIPLRFMPDADLTFICRVVENNVQLVGKVIVNSGLGALTFYKDVTGTIFGAFPNTGFGITSFTWNVA
jgi:hypothetical protein